VFTKEQTVGVPLRHARAADDTVRGREPVHVHSQSQCVTVTSQSGAKQEDKIVVHVDAALQELIPGYLANRHGAIHAMREALEQRDYETIRIVGHSMRGSGGGYGFDTITEIGSALEQAASGRDPDEIHRWMGELLTYLERVQVVYD